MNETCLIIAHDFAPFAGGGVMRIHKFVKYLPCFNINPIVITLKEKFYPSTDHSLVQEYQSAVKIFRTNTIDLKRIYAFFKKEASSTTKIIGVEKKSKFAKICDTISACVFIPDFKILWLPFALKKACYLIKKYQIKKIITTAPPHSVNLIGLILKKMYPEIKWIADFRDTWTENEVYNYPLKIIKLIEEKLELKVFQKADAVICATDSVKKSFIEKYKNNINDINKFSVITNGFDEEDFIDLKNKNRVDTQKILNITYSGSLNDWRNLENFCGALKKLIDTGKISVEKLKIKLCGHIPSAECQRINDYGFEKFFEFINIEPHKKSIERLIETDWLLLIIAEVEGAVVLTGKLFEYIGSAKPVFAIVPINGEAENLIKKYDIGITADTLSVDDIAVKFLKIYTDFFENKQAEYNSNNDYRELFSRKKITEKLAEIIKNL